MGVTRSPTVTLKVFLAHGTSDSDLPVSFTTGFADALRNGGYDLTVALVPDATHHTLYSAEVVGPRLVEWIRALPAAPATRTPR